MGAIAGDSPPGEPQLQKKFRTASSQLCTRTCLCLDLLGKRLSWHSSTARASHQCGLCCSFGTEARCSFIPPKESSECTMLFVFGVPMEFRDPLGTSSPGLPSVRYCSYLEFRWSSGTPLGPAPRNKSHENRSLPARTFGAGGEGPIFVRFALGSRSHGGPGTPKNGSDIPIRTIQ